VPERVQVGGQRRDERLALAGAHLGDPAAVQHHAADHLDVVVALAERALRGLAHRGERLGQQIVERRTVLDLLAEHAGARAQVGVGEHCEPRLEPGDLLDDRDDPADHPVVVAAEECPQRVGHGVAARVYGSRDFPALHIDCGRRKEADEVGRRAARRSRAKAGARAQAMSEREGPAWGD